MVKYSIYNLYKVLKTLPETESYLVAYSGGMDSHVLLHSLKALADELQAQCRGVVQALPGRL